MAERGREGPETAWLRSMDRTVRETAQAATGPRELTATLPEALADVEPNAVAWLGSVTPGGAAGRVRIRGASGEAETPAIVDLGGNAPGPTERAATEGEVVIGETATNPEYEQLRETSGIPAAALSLSVPLGDPDAPPDGGVLHLYTDVEASTAALRDVAAVLGGTVADSYRSVAAAADRDRERRRLEAVRSTLSHDVGNPINLASGRLELAAEDVDSDHLRHVDLALSRIETLVEGCQSFVEAGEPVEERERRSVADLARGCWADLPTGESSLDAEDVRVAAEPARLALLLTELLENAIVHTDDPVTVRVETLDANGGFAVEDTGEGIPDDEREYVFDRGYTTDPDREGQGLAIAREIARAHGWRLALGDPEEGTRVELHTDRW